MLTRVVGGLMMGVVMVAAGGVAASAEDAPRIKWEREVYAGFQKATKQKKLLIVYFRQDYHEDDKGPARFSVAVDEILRGKGAGAFADKAVWAWQTLGLDDNKRNAAQLMRDLKVERFPTLVVLEVTPDSIQERGRIIGSFPEKKYLAHLQEILGGGKATNRPAGAVPPKRAIRR